MKTLQSALPLTALKELEQQSVACWDQLHVPGSIHKASQITADMPALVLKGAHPLVYVTYPTYKVCVLLPENDTSHDVDVESVLRDVSHRSRVQNETLDFAIVDRHYIGIPSPAYWCCTTCLGADCQENVNICNEITKILDQENFQYIVTLTYRYRAERIAFLEDGDSFKLL